jgi:hypothetical protein
MKTQWTKAALERLKAERRAAQERAQIIEPEVKTDGERSTLWL